MCVLSMEERLDLIRYNIEELFYPDTVITQFKVFARETYSLQTLKIADMKEQMEMIKPILLELKEGYDRLMIIAIFKECLKPATCEQLMKDKLIPEIDLEKYINDFYARFASKPIKTEQTPAVNEVRDSEVHSTRRRCP